MNPLLASERSVRSTLRCEVVTSLTQHPRTLPTRLLYDAEGARLFERITRLEEYYLTRTEMRILERCLPEVAMRIGPDACVVEPGSGSGRKTRILLKALSTPRSYVPVDVADGQMGALAGDLRREFPTLRIHPVNADYTRAFSLPSSGMGRGRTVVFFPGSTIGNFEPDDARDFLQTLADLAGPGGALLLGADLLKPASVVEPAYNDKAGVTAEFNRNMLRHVNRLLGADFDPNGFRHRAIWVPHASRIEMHLISLLDQEVTFPGIGFEGDAPVRLRGASDPHDRVLIPEGDHIVTEHSYKHTPEALTRLALEAGWITTAEWRDDRNWFSVRYLERAHDRRPVSHRGKDSE